MVTIQIESYRILSGVNMQMLREEISLFPLHLRNWEDVNLVNSHHLGESLLLQHKAQQRWAVIKGKQCNSWPHRIKIPVPEALIPPALYPASSVCPLHIPTSIEIWCNTFHLKIRAKKKKKINFIAPPTTSPLPYILFKKVVSDHSDCIPFFFISFNNVIFVSFIRLYATHHTWWKRIT